MAVVEIHELHKRFGSVHAVKGLSFDVQAGRVTGFLGPNGARKSTTLRAGVLRCDLHLHLRSRRRLAP